jgi:DNA modification methylase
VSSQGSCSCDDGIALIHGDCRDVLSTLEPETVDLVVTDPQYGIFQVGMKHKGPPGKGTRSLDFFDDATPKNVNDVVMKVWELLLSLMSSTGSAYWWVGHYTFGPLVEAYSRAGWKTRFIVWQKVCPCPAPPGSGWPSAAELCVYAFRKGRVWTHNAANQPRSNVLCCDSYRHGMPGKEPHPTQKPIGLIEPLILMSSLPGQLCLDMFCGSGTTLVVAKSLGRKAVGIDIEEKYIKIAACRLRNQREPLFTPSSEEPLTQDHNRLFNG